MFEYQYFMILKFSWLQLIPLRNDINLNSLNT